MCIRDRANTPQLLRYDLRSMTEVLRELFADEFADPAGNDLIEPFPCKVKPSNILLRKRQFCKLDAKHRFAGIAAVWQRHTGKHLSLIHISRT